MRRLLVKLARSAEVALNSWLRFGIVAKKSIDVQIANSSIGFHERHRVIRLAPGTRGCPPRKRPVKPEAIERDSINEGKRENQQHNYRCDQKH